MGITIDDYERVALIIMMLQRINIYPIDQSTISGDISIFVVRRFRADK